MNQQVGWLCVALHRPWLWVLCLFCLLGPSQMGEAQEKASQAAQAFLRLHPDNPHYFQWRGQPTLLVTSGEHYGALMNLDFDYVTYFDELQRHGLNHTRVFSGVYREDAASFQITENTLAPKSNRYLCPWARSTEAGYHAGGNRFDLSRWDEDYFRRLKDLLLAAAERGIVIELTLFCPMYEDSMWTVCPMKADNNVNGVGDCPREEVYTMQHEKLLEIQLAVTRKIVHELREYGNLYYEVCNEPYFGGVTIPWQHRIVEEIVAAEKGFPHQHLISMNIANGSQKVEQPHPNVSIFNFHYCVPPDAVSTNYDLDRVIGENETGFRGKDDILYRTEGWDFLLAGGGLYNNLDYSFTATHPAGTLQDYQSPGGGSAPLRHQLGVLKRFLEGFDFVHMQPRRDLIKNVSPELIVNGLAQPGQAYAVYLHVPLSDKTNSPEKERASNLTAKLEMELSAGSYLTTWIDPLSGDTLKSVMVDHAGGTHEFTTPPLTSDIALSIEREAR